MNGRFPFAKLSTYPHMGPNDAVIWERFLQKFPKAYASVDYDVRFGSGGFATEEVEDNVYAENLAGLSMFRIDVIGHKPDGGMDCIEVRPHAGLSAFGSALGCCHFLQTENPDKKCTPVIITDVAQSDMGEITLVQGVELVEVGVE